MLTISDNKNAGYSISCLSAIEYAPKIKTNDIPYRPSLSFLAVIRGKYQYFFNGNIITVKAGNVLFLPRAITYRYSISGDDAYTMQVTFDIFPDELNSIIPTAPFVLNGQSSQQIIAEFPKLIRSSRKTSVYSAFTVSSILFRFLSFLINEIEPLPYSTQLLPAVKFLEQNYNQSFSVSDLAKLCNLSTSQFRRRFEGETGTTPLKYKNKLRITEACRLLESREMNISEIAGAMNFESLYAFSKFFKKETGVAPSKWHN